MPIRALADCGPTWASKRSEVTPSVMTWWPVTFWKGMGVGSTRLYLPLIGAGFGPP